jgi:hypothetical protein
VTAHASLGASSAYRWMACPGSPREIAALPHVLQDRTSFYAAQGTVAHGLLERAFAGEDIAALLGTVIHYTERGADFEIEVTQDMVDAVTIGHQVGLEEQARLPGSSILIEERVFPLPDRPDMFGTSDMIIAQPWGELVVVDYKHGVGHVVEAEGNPQLMYYALGALVAAGGAAEFAKVSIVIVQPRAPHDQGRVRRWEIDPVSLVEWSDVLRAAADRTLEPDAPILAGDHCRFCAAKGRCGAFRSMINAELQGYLDREPLEDQRIILPDASDALAIARAKKLIPAIDAWIKSIEGMAQRLMEAGYTVAGYKMVRRRSNRDWTDDAMAVERLRSRLLDEAVESHGEVDESVLYTTPKLRSPAQLEGEKALGGTKKEREAFIAALVTKPPGGLAVVPESDPRDAVDIPRAVEILDAGPQSVDLLALPAVEIF